MAPRWIQFTTFSTLTIVVATIGCQQASWHVPVSADPASFQPAIQAESEQDQATVGTENIPLADSPSHPKTDPRSRFYLASDQKKNASILSENPDWIDHLGEFATINDANELVLNLESAAKIASVNGLSEANDPRSFTKIAIGSESGLLQEPRGFVGMLGQFQTYRNARANLSSQQRTLEQLQEQLRATGNELPALDQLTQSLSFQRGELMRARNELQESIERFVVESLGLPPDLKIKIDDAFLEPLQLNDPLMTEFQREVATLAKSTARQQSYEEIKKSLEYFVEMQTVLTEYLVEIRFNLGQITEIAERRKAGLTKAEVTAFDKRLVNLEVSAEKLSDKIKSFGEPTRAFASKLTEAATNDDALVLSELVERFAMLHQELLSLQASVRVESIVVPKVELSPSEAMRIASDNRKDWKSQRELLASDALRLDQSKTELRRSLIRFEDAINARLRNTLRRLMELESGLEIQRSAVVNTIQKIELYRGRIHRSIQDYSTQVSADDVKSLNLAMNQRQKYEADLLEVWLAYYATRMTLARDLGVLKFDSNGSWLETPFDSEYFFGNRVATIPQPIDRPDATLQATPKAIATPIEETPAPTSIPENTETTSPAVDLELESPRKFQFDGASEPVEAIKEVIEDVEIPLAPEQTSHWKSNSEIQQLWKSTLKGVQQTSTVSYLESVLTGSGKHPENSGMLGKTPAKLEFANVPQLSPPEKLNRPLKLIFGDSSDLASTQNLPSVNAVTAKPTDGFASTVAMTNSEVAIDTVQIESFDGQSEVAQGQRDGGNSLLIVLVLTMLSVGGFWVYKKVR